MSGNCSHPRRCRSWYSNLYLNEVDKMLEKAIETTRYQRYTAVQYARFADDLVILVDFHPRHDWLVKAVVKRLSIVAKVLA
jgi:RNA-directed DNA polymerase